MGGARERVRPAVRQLHLLHITAHLGGGVGKVLSRLVEHSARHGDGVRHTIVCLEAPEKPAFADHARNHGGTLYIGCDTAQLAELIEASDIVQVEWWHHPILAGWLCGGALPAMRLVVWSHVSGLSVPELFPAFVAAPQRFLFTSPCSGLHPALVALDGPALQRVDAVFSSSGFDDLTEPPACTGEWALRVGYVGTLNFAKLHPGLLDFVAAVDLPDFRLALVGDPTTGSELLEEAQRRHLTGRLDIRGYRADVAAELAGFDAFAYILNPRHYGTTENALLEAMAMGVVPVVLDNPAERFLVRHGETGVVVDSPRAFADAIVDLARRPEWRARLARAASLDVRTRFAVGGTAERLNAHYRALMGEEKRTWDFRGVFGAAPADWFLACQGQEAWRFRDDGCVDLNGHPPHSLFERSKGSALHYHRYFPDDPKLKGWAADLSLRQPGWS